ncbi:MAG: glycosyltransferase [Paludibacteraceae bacterium]|nr:glycosyltransferase [Paludibacteraceae bacterium]
MRVSSDMPDDVRLLHDALDLLRNHKSGEPLTLWVGNCGTALRFLQVHLAKCYPDEPITLDGEERLLKVRDGKPTSQTTSARILHGDPIPVTPDESPYITMSRRLAAVYQPSLADPIEPDWSAAAFWYEYIAIHGGELLLEGLTSDSLQGDRIVADIYATHFGVTTEFTSNGAIIVCQRRGLSAKRSVSVSGPTAQRSNSAVLQQPQAVSLDFERIPDLYPAIALTCERLGITLHATGTDRLRFKESDRLEAVRLHEVRNDHRMAMALMAADYIHPLPAYTPDDEATLKCIAKSYPHFVESLLSITTVERRSNDGRTTVEANVFPLSIYHITPIRGVNDDNRGKKHALSKLIHAATSDYLWLHDDDVILPPASNSPQGGQAADLIILPLIMVSESEKPSLLEKLQIAEYAAIQELTMRTAKRGHAVMCSGANLIVKREVWLACEPDIHPEIPSGDDMFLLEAAKRRGYTISVIDDPAYTAIVRPQTTWSSFFRQRMRWAGKAPHYTDRDIRRCGTLIVAANILQLLCPPILLIKFPIEYSLIRKREKIFNFQFPCGSFARNCLSFLSPYKSSRRPLPQKPMVMQPLLCTKITGVY